VTALITAAAPTATVTYPTPTTSGGVAPVAVSCSRPSGSAFGAGTTSVQCTAMDAASASASCDFAVTVTSVPQLRRTRFLAFGDSLTSGEVSVPMSLGLEGQSPVFRMIIVPAASYPTQLLSRLRARYTSQSDVLEVINAGAPGEWAQDGVRRLPNVLANARPEAVLLFEGLNDLGAESRVSPAAAALDTMAREIRNRGARLFLATVPPPGVGPRALSDSQITALNDRIRTIAAGEGAVLVDLYQGLLANVALYIGSDGLHPNEAGYQRMAELFFEAIRSEFEVP
jgi:lysophospholipase L1-like esterase